MRVEEWPVMETGAAAAGGGGTWGAWEGRVVCART